MDFLVSKNLVSKMIIEGDDTVLRTETPITEESLMSLEKLDRASPDLWPEEGISKFVAQNLPQTNTTSWSTNLTPEDTNQLYHFGNLSINEIILEVKKLHDIAYQLGLEESKEMTRGKYLNIFNQK